MGLLSGSTSAYKSVDRTNFTATNGQTTFTVTQGYNVGDVDVYLNGVKLFEGDDYYATNGTTVVVNSACSVGDVIQVVSYNQFLTANSYTKSEADSRYMVASGSTPMTSYLRTPNYGVSSWSDSANASLEASVGAGTQGVGIKAWGRSVPTSGGELTYVTDTRGASGNHIWYGYNGTALVQQMKIDPVGRLNIPNQPVFYAYGGPAGTTIVGPQIFPSTRINVGSYYNATTGRFTAPIAGNYAFNLHLLHRGNNTSSNVEITFYKNGSNINTRGMAYSVNSSSGGHTPMHTTVILPLAAGDYVQGGASVIGSGSDIYLADNLGHFSGYLIG